MAEKEVHFGYYCSRCAYATLPETADPCDECLTCPVSEDSHRPVYYKEEKRLTSQK